MEDRRTRKIISIGAFSCALALLLATLTLYLYNIIAWGKTPDFGFYRRTSTGIRVIGVVMDVGRKSGLEVGDTILRVNEKTFANNREFRAAQKDQVGGENTYLIERGGTRFEITIVNSPMGFATAFVRSGLLWLAGACYILIGTLVFLMKPHRRTSWIFLLFGGTMGVMISFMIKLSDFSPQWLGTLHILFYTFTPATIIHLTMTFPEERWVIKRYPAAQAIPYLISALLFVGIRSAGPLMGDMPRSWSMGLTGYLLLSLLLFVGSCIQLWMRSSSELARIRSKMILLGSAIAASVPLFETVVNAFFRIYIVPGFNYYLPFFVVFPAFVGYSIVKHDLFDIDAIIKRTYGYILTTGTMAGIYGFFVLISNLTVGRYEVVQSPLFPLIFMLAVVFLFNPVRNRAQKLIDRVFYRLEYDYQETVQKISESMRTLLGLDQIGRCIMDTALGTMFIDSGSVLLLNKEKKTYQSLIHAGKREARQGGRPEALMAAGECVETGGTQETGTSPIAEARLSIEEKQREKSTSPEIKIPVDAPFIQKMAQRKREATIYDIQEDPFFEDQRGSCERTMAEMEATLVVPLIYEEELLGLITLGDKKSGKFYRQEDINLLKTLANQGSVAIENALLLEEMIEKERMEEELAIARDLQTSMLPATPPEIAGLNIAALSLSAREVGGDFFDFIQMGEGKVGLVVGDVTGKSVSGALVMSASRSIFRMLSEQGLSVNEIMIRANQRLKKDIKTGMFVALLYAVVDTKSGSLSLCSAGQTQPICVSAESADARIVETQGDTFPLGILEEADYMETRVGLAPGDMIVFYTDGIVEAKNEREEIFGFERLTETVAAGKSLKAEGLLKEIMKRVTEFVGTAAQSDDLTVIVVKVEK